MEKDPSYLDVKSGNYQFPNRDISEENKDKPAYNLNYAKAIYHRYVNDKCGILYGTRDDLDLIRLYGKGAQPTSIYKNWYNEKARDDDDTSVLSAYRNDKTRQGWENIATRPVSPLPRIRNILKGYIDNVGQDVFVDAIDPISNDMKQNMKWHMFTVAQNMDFINEYHMKAGIPQQELEFMPVTETELNLFEAMGGFKMNYARVMEQLIKHTEKISEVDDRLKDEWVDDAVDLGVIAARLVYDRDIKKYKYRYIDPKYLVIQFVESGDYSRSEWAGYVEPYTISELKQVLPDQSEDFFRQLAYIHRDKHGNKAGVFSEDEDWDNFSKHQSTGGMYDYDDFIVEVLECEWIDYKARRHLVYTNRYDHKTVRQLSKDSEVKLTENQKKRGSKDLKTQMRRLRGCKWVIGTDTTFDEGLVNMQDRPKLTDVMHSFRLYTLSDLPLTEQLIPVADNMALSWYRWQDDRASLQRAGYAIDVGMMDNINSGGEDFNFIEVLKMWRDSRYLLHQQSLSGKYEGGGITPVTPIPSMVLEALQEFLASWDHSVKMIEDLTGINLVMLGATAPEGSQVTTTQMSMQSAAHVLKPIIKNIGRMKTELAETLIRRLQLAFKARKDIAKGYVDVIGEADVELLRMAEKDAVQYGLHFEDKPSEEQVRDILDAARASLEARRQGMPGIDISQYMYISQQLSAGGNIKELSALLDYLQKKSEQTIQANKERDIQMQNEGLARIEQQKAQTAAQQKQADVQGDVILEREKRMTELQKIREERGERQAPAGTSNQPPQPSSPQSSPQVPVGA
jgi:hypothetical protein